MAALARWCVRNRLVSVLLWLLAFGGVTAAAAVTGSAASHHSAAPGPQIAAPTQRLHPGFPRPAARWGDRLDRLPGDRLSPGAGWQ